jgi:type II secretory pathway pseudopilin PulG
MNPNSDMRKLLITRLGRNQMMIATSTRGFTLIESIAALGCLVVFTLILISAWHTGWDTGDDKEQARALRLSQAAEQAPLKAAEPSPSPADAQAKPDAAKTPD